MNRDTHSRIAATRVYHVKTMPRNENLSSNMSGHIFSSKQTNNDRSFKGKNSELKCSCCHNTGHLVDRCWQLHPEIKLRFANERKGYQKRTNYKSHLTNLSTKNFTTNPAALINDFSNYLQDKHNHGKMQSGSTRTTG
jgi:hypothetical protein